MDIVWIILGVMLALVLASVLLCASGWIWYWTRVGWRWARREHYREERHGGTD